MASAANRARIPCPDENDLQEDNRRHRDYEGEGEADCHIRLCNTSGQNRCGLDPTGSRRA